MHHSDSDSDASAQPTTMPLAVCQFKKKRKFFGLAAACICTSCPQAQRQLCVAEQPV
jgi:hypothetical protein